METTICINLKKKKKRHADIESINNIIKLNWKLVISVSTLTIPF